ncbi:MAG TPA: MFS transporter [Candidatus Limnocylindria bacterium]|nr:MFS transporter [Candidatus Limnocylindria bacterium]
MTEVAEPLEAAAERGLLRNRAFLAIWSAQILSQTAANAITFTLIVLVAELTKSNTQSSILILLAIAPAVVFGIVAGVVVDRTDRKRVLIITNIARALSVLPLLLFGHSVAMAYVVNFLVAAVTTFFVPAESAALPSLVRKRDLMAANSLFTFTFNGAFLVGFILLAPIVIRIAGYDALFLTTAAMFTAAAALCLTLPLAPQAHPHLGVEVAGAAVAQTRRGVGEALAYLRRSPQVAWALVYVALTYTLVAVAGALAPGYVREVLATDEKNVVILVAPAGVGVVAGIGLLNVFARRFGHSHAIGLGLGACFFALLSLAASRPLTELFRRVGTAELGEAFPFFVALTVVLAFVFGIAYAWVTVPAMTLIQEELTDDMRGRVFGVLNMLVSVFSFLPLIVVGPIADLWGVAPVFVGFAAIVGALWWLGRSVRKRIGAAAA